MGLRKIRRYAACMSSLILFVLPASPNYQLYDVNFGSGSAGSESTNYQGRTLSGDAANGLMTGANYQLGAGAVYANQASVPPAPTFTNVLSSYSRLQLILDPTGNQNSGATFAVAISPDAFASTTQYVQSDGTIGATLGDEDWLTYTSWGGASGTYVVGLTASTTYTVKVTARHSDLSQSAYGPTDDAITTSGPSLSFDLDVSATDSDTSPPYTVAFGLLDPGTVATATNKVWVDVASNAVNGVSVYLRSASGGLESLAAGYTITSTSANLAAVSEGVGAQVSTATQASGGPLAAVAPFNGSSDSVGGLTTTVQEVFAATEPLTGGRGSMLLKAKASVVTPAAADYADTFDIVASGHF